MRIKLTLKAGFLLFGYIFLWYFLCKVREGNPTSLVFPSYCEGMICAVVKNFLLLFCGFSSRLKARVTELFLTANSLPMVSVSPARTPMAICSSLASAVPSPMKRQEEQLHFGDRENGWNFTFCEQSEDIYLFPASPGFHAASRSGVLPHRLQTADPGCQRLCAGRTDTAGSPSYATTVFSGCGWKPSPPTVDVTLFSLCSITVFVYCPNVQMFEC